MAEKRKSVHLQDKTIVIGCGKLGAGIANQRWKKGKSVLVIDPNQESFLRLDKDFSGQTIVADATDVEKLENAGISNAQEIVIATGSDNVNVFVAHLCANRYSPNSEIYVRLDDVNLGKLIENIKNVNPIYPLELSLGKYKLYKEKGGRR